MASPYPEGPPYHQSMYAHAPPYNPNDRVRNLRGKFTGLGGHDVIETRAGVGYRLGACAGQTS